MDDLSARGLSAVVYKTGLISMPVKNWENHVYLYPLVDIFYNLVAAPLTLVLSICSLKKSADPLGIVVNKALRRAGASMEVPHMSYFKRRFARLWVRAIFFAALLKIHRVQKGVLVGYGSQDGLSFTLACKWLGIESTELQHGMISSSMPRYSRWSFVPKSGFDLLPRTFWCWNEFEMSSVYSWISAQSHHKVVSAGNAFLNRREKYMTLSPKLFHAFLRDKNSERGVITCLIALQSRILEPEWLLGAISRFPGKFCWLFKFHPADKEISQRKDRIARYFLKTGFEDYDTELINDPTANIYDCIDASDVVISAFSSSLYEAAMLGKKPVIIHNQGIEHYSEFVTPGIMEDCSSEAKFAHFLKTMVRAI